MDCSWEFWPNNVQIGVSGAIVTIRGEVETKNQEQILLSHTGIRRNLPLFGRILFGKFFEQFDRRIYDCFARSFFQIAVKTGPDLISTAII